MRPSSAFSEGQSQEEITQRGTDPRQVTCWFGRELAGLPDPAFKRRLKLAFKYWRHRGFPFPNLAQPEIEEEYRRLQRTPLFSLEDGLLRSSTVGLRLANSFHPQMWHVPVHGRSPVDCFADDSALRKALKKAVRFWPDRRCWNDQCMRSVMRIYHRSRVSNFRPTAARSLVALFSNEGDTLLDFSAGYGGRLLGTLALKRHYIGIDPASEQVNGLRRMQAALREIASGTAEIHQACAEDYLPSIQARSVGLVLSSPPYFDHEKYSNEETQSWRRYRTYLEWREHFLMPVICHSHRALRKGGYLLINVLDLPRAPVARDTLALAERLFGRAQLLKLALSATPTERAAGLKNYRWEPILTFRKGR